MPMTATLWLYKGNPVEWFARDFDHPLYFEIYRDKELEAAEEGPALAQLLDLPPSSIVLDLPCGWGRLHSALKAKGFRVLGGDLSRLNLQRHHWESPSPLVRMDLRRLPFKDSCAYGVFCAFTSWGYFATDGENLEQLREFARVLKPSGVLLLDLAGRKHLEAAVHVHGNRWNDVDGRYRERVRWSTDGRRIFTERIMEGQRFRHDIWIPTHEEVLAFLSQAGFVIDETYGQIDGSPWHPQAERWIY
jgi:SAM-dependent methyltransferase